MVIRAPIRELGVIGPRQKEQSIGSYVRPWFVAILYSTWLSALTIVFYAVGGVASVALEVTLLSGAIPVVVQVTLLGMDKRGLFPSLAFTFAFSIVILLSFIGNIETWSAFVFFFNILFVFGVAMIVAACRDDDIIGSIAAGYALIGTGLLLIAYVKGEFVLGRLMVFGLHPNFTGLVAVSVGIMAFALRSKVLTWACWAVAFMTIYNTSSRGSMFALLAGTAVFFSDWLRSGRFVLLKGMIVAIAFITLAGLTFGFFPGQSFSILDDVLLLSDPYRGVGTGFTGRVAAWLETLEIWMSSPMFGVGFRQHEIFLTTASSAHNAYLTMLVDTGVIGLAAYLLFIGFALSAVLRGIDVGSTRRFILSVIVSYLVLGLFERRALNAGNAFSIWFIMACFYALRARALRVLK